MARRYKSLLFGSAPDTTIFHREHRSKKGREKKKPWDGALQKKLKLKHLSDREKNRKNYE